MRRASAALTVLFLTAAGCGFSSVDADSEVSISGRALDASGEPLADTRVLLVKQADLGEVIFGSILAVGTLSTICFAPDPPAICDRARSTTTDGDGRYRFDLTGSDVRGSLGTEATMSVAFSGPSGKAGTAVSFTAEDAEISVPDARVWNLRAKVTTRGDGFRLSWRPLPDDATYYALLYDSGDHLLWSQPAKGKHATVDARLLEGLDGAVAVSARSGLAGGSGAGDVQASYASARFEVSSSAGKPPSRGRRCAAVLGTSPTTGGFHEKCGVTDGDLTTPARLEGTGGDTVSGVVVDLGRTRPVDLVVARGFSGQFLVELSSDGTTFRTVSTGTGTAYAVSPKGRPDARYVRLRSPVGLDQSLGAELSVW